MDDRSLAAMLMSLEESEARAREGLDGLEPDALFKAARILLGSREPDMKAVSMALTLLGFHADQRREWSPRPPKGGTVGRKRDSIGLERLKRQRAEFDRAAVTAFQTAIRGGPPPPAWILAGFRGEAMDQKAVAEAIAWAREEWESGRENYSLSDVTPESPLRAWAARAYLRAKGQPDDSDAGRALVRRVEAASDFLENLLEVPE